MVDRAPVQILGIDHVQVAAPAGCEQAARAFYGGLLGLDELTKPPLLEARGGCWFRAGAQELHVGVEEPFAPARKAHPAFLVDSIDKLGRALADAGLDVNWDGNFPGYRRFHVFDPHGNRVEIMGAAAD